MLTVQVAGLKALVLAHRRTIHVTCIIAASVTVAALFILTSTISIVTLHSAQPVRLAMVRKIAKLSNIALFKLFAHLALCVSLGLVKLMALIAAIVQSSIVDHLEVLRKLGRSSARRSISSQ